MPTESRQVVKQLKKEKQQREVDCPLQGSRRSSSLCLIIVCFHEIYKSKILNFNVLIGQQLPSLTCPFLHTFPYGVKWPWSHPRAFVLMGHRQFLFVIFPAASQMLQTCSIRHFVLIFYKKSSCQVLKASDFTKTAVKVCIMAIWTVHTYLSGGCFTGLKTVARWGWKGLVWPVPSSEARNPDFHVKSSNFQMLITNQTKLIGRLSLICGLSVFNPCSIWGKSWWTGLTTSSHPSTPLSSKAFTLKLST